MYGGAQYLVITGLAGHKGTVGIRPNHLSAVTLTLFLTGRGADHAQYMNIPTKF